jgi:hypothetical protein
MSSEPTYDRDLPQLARLSRERPLPVHRIGFVTRRDVQLSEAGLSMLVTAEEPYDPYHNPYADEI